MGYYIETPEATGKAKYLIEKEGGKLVTEVDALNNFDNIAHDTVCVVDNVSLGFEAAAYCYDKSELERCASPYDSRPRQWVILPFGRAARRSGYK